MIYLDNASTTPVDPLVLEAMMPYLTERYGNPGTLYCSGRQAKKAIEEAREQVAGFIGAEPRQIIFTSGGTEANNMVFFSTVNYLRRMGRRHLIVSSVEHDSVLKAAKATCMKSLFYMSLLGVDERGIADFSALSSLITKDTGLVSVMYMNNETGSENDVESMAKLCHENDTLFHTDCVQAAGCCELDVKKMECDFLSLSAHKMHGAKGAGALFSRNPVLTPMIYGGSVQEFGLRGGTENVAAIVGFGKACELMAANLHDIDRHTTMLKQVFYSTLKQCLAERQLEDAVHINGDAIEKHGKTINIRFDNVDGETLLLLLDGKGVCVSAGSACRSHESEPSHVLTAMGISPDDARNSIRVSFSRMNSAYEVKRAAKEIADCVGVLRGWK